MFFIQNNISIIMYYYIIIIIIIMWSEEHCPFSSTSASVYESELVHSRPVNHVIISLALPYILKKRKHFLHMKYESK